MRCGEARMSRSTGRGWAVGQEWKQSIPVIDSVIILLSLPPAQVSSSCGPLARCRSFTFPRWHIGSNKVQKRLLKMAVYLITVLGTVIDSRTRHCFCPREARSQEEDSDIKLLQYTGISTIIEIHTRWTNGLEWEMYWLIQFGEEMVKEGLRVDDAWAAESFKEWMMFTRWLWEEVGVQG